MTTWTDVINFVRMRYEVLEESNSWLRFRLDTDGDRTQQVAVHHVTAPELIEISSPVGWADKIDVERLHKIAEDSPVDGADVVDGVALLKHSVPLTDLDIYEFERHLTLVVTHADTFERELTGTDEF